VWVAVLGHGLLAEDRCGFHGDGVGDRVSQARVLCRLLFQIRRVNFEEIGGAPAGAVDRFDQAREVQDRVRLARGILEGGAVRLNGPAALHPAFQGFLLRLDLALQQHDVVGDGRGFLWGGDREQVRGARGADVHVSAVFADAAGRGLPLAFTLDAFGQSDHRFHSHGNLFGREDPAIFVARCDVGERDFVAVQRIHAFFAPLDHDADCVEEELEGIRLAAPAGLVIRDDGPFLAGLLDQVKPVELKAEPGVGRVPVAEFEVARDGDLVLDTGDC
jgi:hypothetical protein